MITTSDENLQSSSKGTDMNKDKQMTGTSF